MKNDPSEHHFSDGSSITVLENGSIVLRENRKSTGEPLNLAEPRTISYNDPPPPPATSSGLEAREHE